jgi:hypothetical protein
VNWTNENQQKVIAALQAWRIVLTPPSIGTLVDRLQSQGKLEDEMQAAANEKQKRYDLFNFYLGSKFKASNVDFDSMENLVKITDEFCDTNRFPHLRLGHIAEVVAELDLKGELRRVQPSRIEVVEVIKEVPVGKPLSKAEQLQRIGLDGNANKLIRTELDDAPDRRPAVKHEELEIVARLDLATNSIVNDVLADIRNYSGRTHAITQRRREQLFEIVDKYKSQVETPADAHRLSRTVKAQIAKWHDNGSIR